jgi:thiol-disulfide isomerase/thioredoxin
MKRLNIYIMMLLTAVLFFSCDKVDEPYLINKGPVGSGGGETGKRVILVEEFTGHRCTNCPEAAIELANLKAQYDDQMIIIAVHAGFSAMPLGEFTADYRTDAGNTLNDFFGVTANPSGMVSRAEFDGSRVLGKDEWQSAIESLLDDDAMAEIALESSYNNSTREAEVSAEIEVLDPESADYKFCLVLIEDDIESPQSNNNPDVGDTPTIHDWHHKHVLRGAVNGTWGETFDAASGATTRSYTFEIAEDWNEDNCAFVAYIYRDDTKEVIHAAEIHVNE